MQESLTGFFYEVMNQMAKLVKNIRIDNDAPRTTETICAVDLNTVTVTAELGIGYRVVVYADGVVTLTPVTHIFGGNGIITVRDTPAATTASEVEFAFAYSKGPAQATGTTVDNQRLIYDGSLLRRFEDGEFGVSDGDAGGGTQKESDENSSH